MDIHVVLNEEQIEMWNEAIFSAINGCTVYVAEEVSFNVFEISDFLSMCRTLWRAYGFVICSCSSIYAELSCKPKIFGFKHFEYLKVGCIPRP